jgi:magnesium-protoporphyrin IX monomethyl ester (oxidative) cyclase
MNMHATTHDELHAEISDRFDTTAMATDTTLLNPRFYTTDFDELDRIDVSPVRQDWDVLLDQMRSDPNKGHFKKNADWDKIDWTQSCAPNSSIFWSPAAPPNFRAACCTKK